MLLFEAEFNCVGLFFFLCIAADDIFEMGLS